MSKKNKKGIHVVLKCTELAICCQNGNINEPAE